MSINKSTTYTVTCNCGASITAKSISEISKHKWYVNSNTYPPTQDSIKDLICPECNKKRLSKLYNSTDIRKRISGNYYSINPKKWNDDLLKELGIEKNHPKAKLLLKLSWDYGHSSGYFTVLNYAEDLSEFF